MLKSRVVTALFLILATGGTVMFLDTRWVAAVAAAFLIAGAWEWARLAGMQRPAPRAAYASAVAAAIAVCWGLRGGAAPGWIAATAVLGWLAAAALIAACQRRRVDAARLRGRAVIGVCALVPVFPSVVALHSAGPRDLLLFLLVLVSVADSAAFFGGRRFGRVPLCSGISPGKTREGLYAALAAGLATGAAYAGLRGFPPAEALRFLLLCLCTVAASVVGDLLESLMKRGAGVKDSGALLPGHGGVLDRIDSFTAAGPVFYTGMRLLGA